MIEPHTVTHKMKLRLTAIFLVCTLLLVSLVSAYQYVTVYNPFTGKLDYVTGSNFTGHNITADNFFSPNWDGNLTNILTPDPYLYNGSGGPTVILRFNETYLNITIDRRATGLGDNESWNETYADTKYIDQSEEGNLNTNSSTFWAGLSSFISKWFYSSGNILNFNETLLNLTIDQRDNYAADTNASTECSGTEVLLGNSSCLDSSGFYDDTDTDSQKNTSGEYLYNDSQTIYFNETKLNSTIDNRAGGDNSSWNETYADGKYLSQDSEGNLNVNSSEYWDDLNSFNATQMENSGGVLNILRSWLDSLYLRVTGGTISGNLTVTQRINVSDWANVTLTESQISDLSHTTDTNASTICSGTTTYLDGEGNCDDISGDYMAIATDTWVNETGDTMTGNLNMQSNITFQDNDYACFGSGGCVDSYIYFNGSTLIIKVN